MGGRCQRCGCEIPEKSPQGLCPACLLRAPTSDTDTLPETVVENTGQVDQPLPTEDASHISDKLHGRYTPGAVIAGRYRIVTLLGRGGMGEVYRADDLKLGQPVALKFLPPELGRDEARLRMFHDEVRLARQVSHPNICRVYDIGETPEGNQFISMEFIGGEDLHALLKRIGRLPKERGAEIAQQICAGLSAAHRKGVLHRDLKPANIMIDGDGQARITDFGLACLTDEDATTTAGTPAYMAPEQLEGADATTASDLYAFGLVLYELFTGKRCFSGLSADEVTGERDTAPMPRTPSSLVEDMDPAVESVVMRCLEPEPAERPRSAIEVAAALPGGDPLAAALAAGETPSPEVVAAAPVDGRLTPRVATLFLVSLLVMLFGKAVYDNRLKIFPQLPVETLDSLADETMRGVQNAHSPGVSAPSAGLPEASCRGLVKNHPFLRHALEEQSQSWDEMEARTTAPTPYLFWKRWSQEPLQTGELNAPQIGIDTPPRSRLGSATVVLDSSGTLLGFEMIPAESADEDTAPESEPTGTGFEFALAKAGFDLEALVPTAPVPGVIPGFCDRADDRAWSVGTANDPAVGASTIYAGFVNGKLHFFVRRWEEWSAGKGATVFDAGGQRDWRGLKGSWLVFLQVLMVVAAAIMGWRNTKMGRGDRTGAFHFAAIVFASHYLEELTSFTYGGVGWVEILLHFSAGRGVAHALLQGFITWLAYMAVEPYARRFWPRSLVGWTRLSRGRATDPQVGFELLVGIVAAAAIGTVLILTSFLADAIDIPNSGRLIDQPNTLAGIKAMLTKWSSYAAMFLFLVILTFVFLIGFRLITRSESAAIWITVAASTTVIYFGSRNNDPLEVEVLSVAFAFLISAAQVLLLVRVGLIAAVTVRVAAHIILNIPLSSAAAYAPQMILGLGVVITAAVIGLRLSLGTGSTPRYRKAV